MTNFISQYCAARAGTTVSPRFTRYCALHVLQLAIGRKIVVDHGHFTIDPIFYLCLIGDPSSGKSTAMRAAKHLFTSTFPDYPIGPDICSRENIIKTLNRSDMRREYRDEFGNAREYRPMAFFLSEFKNFISFAPQQMTDFLTNIYEEEVFKSGTIQRGLEDVVGPLVTVLGCMTPPQITELLRMKVMGDGFMRRLIPVWETEAAPRIPFPEFTPHNAAAFKWCQEHIRKISTLCGKIRWADGAKEFFTEWDLKNGKSKDPVFAGYYASKDILAQRFAILIALSKENPQLEFTVDILQEAIDFMESNEDSLERLSVNVGQNPFLVTQNKLVEAVDSAGGCLPMIQFHRLANLDLDGMSFRSVCQSLKETGQLIFEFRSIQGKLFEFVLTPTRWKREKELAAVVETTKQIDNETNE